MLYKFILDYVEVKKNPKDDSYIPYAEMLLDMVNRLDSLTMNNHGGGLRVIKIIYCIFKFNVMLCFFN